MNPLVQELANYITKRYKAIEERPWASSPRNITFKEPLSGKWFALIMPVRRALLGGGSSDTGRGDEEIYIVNVKADPEFIYQISQTPGYMPGYHMNKRRWLTIYLDGTVPVEQILDCIDTSYALLTDTPTRRIYEAVKKIPKGCVATYGQVAAVAGEPKMARAVGNALHKNPDPDNIPCFRVVNAKGELAGGFAFGGAEVQAELLKRDGVEVTDGRVDLERFGWKI